VALSKEPGNPELVSVKKKNKWEVLMLVWPGLRNIVSFSGRAAATAGCNPGTAEARAPHPQNK